MSDLSRAEALMTRTWQPLIGDIDDPNATLGATSNSQSTQSTVLRNTTPVFDLAQSDQAGNNRPEFELLEQISEGGMAVVYSARQTSMDRHVALKMANADMAPEESEAMIAAEAAVIGHLDHPNIIPIHDMGRDGDGELFYVMKSVHGTKWQDVLADRSIAQNLDTLMRVSDAVAYAHAHDIIHRDLKPNNVMLGNFGEVLVINWGLAAAVSRKGTAPSLRRQELAGSPAYMAPEMAQGVGRSIGIHSDVYLLGAILYQCVTGQPPHSGSNVANCIYHAAQNRIDDTGHTGGLMEIAQTAMATDAKDRYPSVKAFQAAIREYQSHAESIAVAKEADKQLAKARQGDDYVLFARAMYGYEQALELWSGNRAAVEGASAARLEYATRAAEKSDLDLAQDLVDGGGLHETPLGRRVASERQDRDERETRLRKTARGVAFIAFAVVVVLAAGLLLLQSARNTTEDARQRVSALLIKADAAEKQAVAMANQVGLIGKRAAANFVDMAQNHVRRGELDQAAEIVSIARELDADNLEALLLQTQFDAANKAYNEAWVGLERYCQARPGNLAAFQLLVACRAAAAEGERYEPIVATALQRNHMHELANRFDAAIRAREQQALKHFRQAYLEFDQCLMHMNATDRMLFSTRDCKLSDLSPLRGLPINRVLLTSDLEFADLSPLRGMALDYLWLRKTRVDDLSALAGMPLTTLQASNTQIVTLTPLKGAPLRKLSIAHTAITDLTALRGMPLEELSIQGCKVADLTPLADARLVELNFSPEYVRTGLDAIRNMDSLERISDGRSQPLRPHAFWRKHNR